MTTGYSVPTKRGVNRTNLLGRLITIFMASLGVAAVAFVLGWVGRKALVKITSDLADRPYIAANFASAAQRYSWALSLDAQHLHSRVNRAMAYRALNQMELANADWQACAKTQPRSDAEYTLRAECYLQLRQPREALADLQHELTVHPDNADAYAMRARTHAQLNQLELALADIAQAIALQPERAEFFLQRSELRERTGNLTDALADATQAITLQQNAPTPVALLRRAHLLKQTSSPSAAALAYDQVIALLAAQQNQDPLFTATVLQERAQLRMVLGLWDGALTDVEAALTLVPSDISLRLRARIYRTTDKMPAALSDLDDLLTRNPDDVKLLRMRAAVQESLGNVDAMQQDWLRVIALDPNNAQAYVELGVSEWKQHLNEEAMLHLSQAIELNTTDVAAYAVRGRLWLEREQSDAAVRDLSQALVLKPNDVANLLVRGKAYHALNQFAQAQADFDQAVQLAPNNAQAFLARGRFFAKRDQPAQALPDLKQALALFTNADPKVLKAHVWHEQAIVQDALGDVAAAQASLEKARVLAPTDLSVLKLLAKLLQKQGKLDELRTALAELREMQATQSVPIQLRMAKILEKQGKVDEALVIYTNLLSQTISSDEQLNVYVNVGKLHYGLQRYKLSLASYEAALKLDKTQPDIFLGVGLNRRKLGYTCGAARSFRVYLKLATNPPQRDELLAWLGKQSEC